jgi:hypothetical protein
MLSSDRRVYMLAEYTVENRKDGWYFGCSARFGDREEMKGPYSSVASVTLVIARQLKQEITKRHAPRTAEA